MIEIARGLIKPSPETFKPWLQLLHEESRPRI